MNQPLHIKTFIAVFISTALIAIVTSVWQYSETYRGEVNDAHLALLQLAETVQTTAAIAAYLDNQEIARDVVQGLAKNEIVAVVEFASATGLKVTAGSVVQGDRQLTPVTYDLQSPFSENEQVGKLTIIPKEAVIHAHARDAAYRQAIIMGLNTFVAALLVMIVVYRLLIRPIKKLSFNLNQATPGETVALEFLPGHRRDEIGSLTEDANRLLVSAKQTLDGERALQEELRRHRDHLEELVSQRTADLQAETLRAEAASRAKSEFLSLMSHELRTPLNAILGYSQLLDNEFRSSGKQEYVEDIGKILTSGDQLLSIIESVLDLSQVETGKMELALEKFSVADLCKEIIAMAEALAAKKNNRLIADCADENLVMYSDRQKIKQIVLSLISNAAKFSSNGDIRLLIREALGSPDSVEFSVADNGIGISAEQLSALFQPFTQLDNTTTRRFGGTGLGLYLSKQIAELLHGSIAVQSQEGVGSTFTVRLSRIIDQAKPTST